MTSFVTYSCLDIPDTPVGLVFGTFLVFDLIVFIGSWTISFVRYDETLFLINTLLLGIYGTLYHLSETFGVVSAAAIPCTAIIQSYRYEFPNPTIVDTLVRFLLLVLYYWHLKIVVPGFWGWALLSCLAGFYIVSLGVLQIVTPTTLLFNVALAVAIGIAVNTLVLHSAAPILKNIRDRGGIFRGLGY